MKKLQPVVQKSCAWYILGFGWCLGDITEAKPEELIISSAIAKLLARAEKGRSCAKYR